MISNFAKFHPVVKTLLIGTLLTALFRSMCYPFITMMLGTRTHLPVEVIGILIGIGALASSVGAYVGGTLSDRFGRERLMQLSLVISVIEYAGFAVFSNLYILASLLVIGGFFGSYFDPVSRALTADISSTVMRKRAHSMRYLLANAGYGMGPLLGIWSGLAGSTLPFLFLGAICILYLTILTWLFHRYKYDIIPKQLVVLTVEETGQKFSLKTAFSVLGHDYALVMIVVGGICTTTIEGLWTVPMAAYLPQKFSDGEAILAILLTVNAVTVVIAQSFLMLFMEQKSPVKLVIFGSLLFAAGEVGFAFSNSLICFVAFMVVFTLGEVLILPSQYALLDNIAPPKMNGSYYGAFALNGFGNFLGPWLSTLLLDKWGGQIMLVILAAIALMSILCYKAGEKLHRERTSIHQTAIKS
ncbi:MDR family MFS transporter [Paenibacillus sp. GCM10027628]|uniref:MDR family MFS transporter n=1 Tax=Paenibacillus sp. GCM10027628 TaxID=3273413 RepID=UPI00362F5E29